jgi:glutamate synthase domain-containing protein 3
MVDLDQMDGEDYDLLRRMIRNHFGYTSSKVARELLEDWESSKHYFVKIMPRDYKAVLAKNSTKMQVNLKTVLAS